MEQQTESLAQGRAGAYRKQPAGYRAFIPAPLPPDPPIQLEGGLQARLSTANLALGRLDGSIQTLPNPDLFVFMYVRKEAVLSSQIEGTVEGRVDGLELDMRQTDLDQERQVIGVCEKGVLLKPVLYLSHYFKRHRETYYALLQKTRDEGAWEDWLAFFLDGVAEVSRQATATARRILALREAHRQSVTEQLGAAAGNGHRVLESLYKRPILSVNAVKELTGASYAAANQLVERLVTIGVLREISGQSRDRRFRYDAYIRLFDEPGMDSEGAGP